MKKRMEEASDRWNKGISKFNQYVGIFNQDEFGPVFKHVVDLFKGMSPDDEPIKALRKLFPQHPHEIEFYLPQITVYLLYGSFRNSDILQQLIFDLCTNSPSMAHKVRWFVASFCLSGAGVGSGGVNRLNYFISNVEKCGVSAARHLILPDEDYSESKDDSDSRTMFSVSLSVRPSVEGDGRNVGHDTQAQESKYPLYNTLEVIHKPESGLAVVDGFSPMVSFWDELVQISRDLCPLAREIRTSTLKNKLDEFKNRYLPSAAIFAPVGRTQHRIWNIDVEECFAFSTRERAPIFICLEVVDYTPVNTDDSEEGRRKWGIPDLGIKKSIQRAIDNFGENSPTRSKSRDASVVDAQDTEILQNRSSISQRSTLGLSSSARSDKPILGDRVRSAPLLSELLQIEPDEDSKDNLYEEYVDDSYGTDNIWDANVDVEAPEQNSDRPRLRSLPSRESTTRESDFRRSLDGAGQWAMPSLSKTMLEKRPIEPPKKSFKLGLTRLIELYVNINDSKYSLYLYRWFSASSASETGKNRNISIEKTDGPSERRYEDIADGPVQLPAADVNVNVNIGSVHGNPAVAVINNSSSSTDTNEGYGAVSSDTGEFRFGWTRPKKPFSGKDIEGEMDPHTSANIFSNNRLGQYCSDPSSSGDVSSVTASNIGDPQQPLVVFKEPWHVKEVREKKKSKVGHLPGWRLFPVIIKSGDDLRQEQIISQLMFQIYFILQTRKVGSWLRPYGIIATSPDSGIIEAIPDTVSLDVLRRRVPSYTSLIDFYERFYGDRTSDLFKAARENFVKSLAGYSIVCYILQLKDRHNGNILLDNNGHLMHIDFGFVLGITPGGNMGFEKAPFKLTREMIQLMDGPHSSTFHRYR